TRSFHSGIRLWMGQPEAIPLRSVPVWQKGMPQSMQRAPCSRSFFSSMCRWNSFQSRIRSIAGRSSGNSRKYSIKPVGFPIVYFGQFLGFLSDFWAWGFGFSSTAADARNVAGVFLESSHDGLFAAQTGVFHFL